VKQVAGDDGGVEDLGGHVQVHADVSVVGLELSGPERSLDAEKPAGGCRSTCSW
jgi:hypothetical protein